MTAEAKIKQTKLAFKLRGLIERADPDNLRLSLYKRAADALDLACFSLGARGERIKQLGAYHECLRHYRELSGNDYAG